MSWFKNITLLTLPAAFNVDAAALEPALAERHLRSPGPLEMETRGFVSPFSRDDAAMTHGTDGATLLCLGQDSRVSLELRRLFFRLDEVLRFLA